MVTIDFGCGINFIFLDQTEDGVLSFSKPIYRTILKLEPSLRRMTLMPR